MTDAPSPGNASNARWDPRSLGRRWQIAFFAGLLRLGGARLAHACMLVVAAWYTVFSRTVTRRCRPYLARRFPQAGGLWARRWQTYRRVVALGASLLDRAEGPGSLEISFPDGGRLLDLLGEGRGLIVLNCHVGSWQVALSAFRFLEVPVRVVMHRAAGDIDPRWFQGQGAAPAFSLIDPAQEMGGVLEMIAALDRGEVLGLMGDRVFGADPNTLALPFLGGTVDLPASPYRLAAMRGTPIAVVLSARTGFRRHKIWIGRVLRVPRGRGRQNDAYLHFGKELASCLEDYVRAFPWQFFNFHNMWRD